MSFHISQISYLCSKARTVLHGSPSTYTASLLLSSLHRVLPSSKADPLFLMVNLSVTLSANLLSLAQALHYLFSLSSELDWLSLPSTRHCHPKHWLS